MTIFCIFVGYHITSNGHISAIFWEIWNEIFFGTSEDVLITKVGKKIGASWPLHIDFRSMNSRTWFFGAIFGYGGQNSPWSPLGRATKFYMKEVAIIRNFHFKFEETPTTFVVTMRKNTFFLLKGPFLGAFRYPIIAPTSWFLYFLSLTSWSIPNIEFKLLWPILVPNFFRNHQKRTIFGMFPF